MYWLTVPSMRLPVQIVLNVLGQVHVKQDKVVEVASAEGVSGGPASQAAAPLTDAAHCIQGDLRRALHVLQHRFQGHVGES